MLSFDWFHQSMLLQNQDMVRNEREKALQDSKQQVTTIRNNEKPPTTTSTNSRSWSGALKNPRIVRVSRAFGGKDRHSKVTTIKGLRDRRVRLSVPTAIQLYDLQDRLGLNQPSKVIDWLINAVQSEIDKLPPLHFPPEDHGLMAQIAPNPRSEEPEPDTNVQALSHDQNMASYATYYQWEGANAYLSQPIMSIPYFCPPSIFGSTAVSVTPVQANLEMNSFDHLSGTLGRGFE